MTHQIRVRVGEHDQHVCAFHDTQNRQFYRVCDTPFFSDTPAVVYKKKSLDAFLPFPCDGAISVTLKAGTALSLCRDCITFKMCAV